MIEDAKIEELVPQMSEDPRTEELVREMLVRIADKWTLLVIDVLAEGEMRFSRLREQVGGVSQKMLTKTLRQLERDGLVTRHVHAVVPPRVDYKLTPLGDSLGQAVCGIWIWAEEHLKDVEKARQVFDQESKLPSSN
jgi:DNA-binding HxlR family transcriptional regulator